MSNQPKGLSPWSKTSHLFYPSVTHTSPLVRNARSVHLTVKFLFHSFADNCSRASYTLRPIAPKRTTRAGVKFAAEIRPPPPEYHPWDLKYYQILMREKVKKPMAKNPYQQKQRAPAYATESITSKEECCPSLISPDAVRIQKVFVHQGVERPSKSILFLEKRFVVSPL
jgi:hypothetical protein